MARGDIPCDVLFVGEAPGVSEDALGQPFVGPAGKLLDRVVSASIPTDNGDCSIHPLRTAFTNLVACFPREAKATGDHQPAPDEIKACRQRLKEFVRIAKPKAIICVGQLAKKWIVGQAQFCDEGEDGNPPWLNGESLRFADIDHPAFILRSPDVAQSMLIKRAVLRIKNCVIGL